MSSIVQLANRKGSTNSLKKKLDDLPPERRERVEERAKALIAEEMSRQDLGEALRRR